MHQDGVLKNPLTYEIMRADDRRDGNQRLVLANTPADHAFRKHPKHGIHLSPEELVPAFARFKDVADKKKVVAEREYRAIVTDWPGATRKPSSYSTSSILRHWLDPDATVRLRRATTTRSTRSPRSTGPVDAVCKAVNRSSARRAS